MTTETRTIRTMPYTGPVSRDENRAAHGGICVEVERADGARRLENRNGHHVEVGAWGPTREERRLEAQRATARVREIAAARPAPVEVSHGATVVRVAVDEDGTLTLDAVRGRYASADEPAIAQASGLLPYATGLRAAVVRAEELRAEA